LQDRSAFESDIEYTNAGDVWIGGAIAVAGFALLYNLISTLRTILGNSRIGFDRFFEVLMSTDNGNPLFVLLVYGPFVCIAVAIIAWLMKRATLRSALDKTHQEYVSHGFLADVWQTAADVSIDKNVQALVLYTPPGFPEETVAAFGNWIAAVTHDKNAPNHKEIRKSMAKVQLDPTAPVLATSIDVTFPQGLWLARSKAENTDLGIAGEVTSLVLGPRPVVVVPKNESKANVYCIKNSVPLG
jgi:hypothetical protein